MVVGPSHKHAVLAVKDKDAGLVERLQLTSGRPRTAFLGRAPAGAPLHCTAYQLLKASLQLSSSMTCVLLYLLRRYVKSRGNLSGQIEVVRWNQISDADVEGGRSLLRACRLSESFPSMHTRT
jgi:hypothetical protein